jgi:hypothetical protein
MHMNDHGMSHRTILSKIRTITRATIGNSTNGVTLKNGMLMIDEHMGT